MGTVFVRKTSEKKKPKTYLGIIYCVHWILQKNELIVIPHLPACAKLNRDFLRVIVYGIYQISALQKVSEGRIGIRRGLGMCFASPFFPRFLYLFISCFVLLHSYRVLHILQCRCALVALKNGLHNSQLQFK